MVIILQTVWKHVIQIFDKNQMVFIKAMRSAINLHMLWQLSVSGMCQFETKLDLYS